MFNIRKKITKKEDEGERRDYRKALTKSLCNPMVSEIYHPNESGADPHGCSCARQAWNAKGYLPLNDKNSKIEVIQVDTVRVFLRHSILIMISLYN